LGIVAGFEPAAKSSNEVSLACATIRGISDKSVFYTFALPD